jgi:hypothetical protein
MGRADVPVDADWVQAYLDDPGMVLAEDQENNIKWTRRPLLCSCRHSRDAHRPYRPSSGCVLCECPCLSRWDPVPRPRRPSS